MFGTKHIAPLRLWLFAATLVFCGCFSIPFIGGSRGKEIIEPVNRDFDRINVFAGYDKNDRPIVEMRLLSQEVTEKGLVIHTRMFPTENFRVRNQFRGLRSINYYPIERRFHRLELRYGRKRSKAKVRKNIQVRGIKPFEADFEHTSIYYLLPDTIDRMKLKFQDVKRWDRLPVDTLEVWYASKEEFLQKARQQTRRQNLLNTYERRQKQDRTEQFTQSDSLFVTANNTYAYLNKSVDSEILFTMNAGERIDFGVSDGLWVEFPLPDSLIENLTEFFETRHQRALDQWRQQREQRNRSRTAARQQEAEVDTTSRMTAFVLDVMAAKNIKSALGWEKATLEQPVDVPLFAQVLRDRETAKIARQDSIEQARLDSIQAYADSLVRIDSLRTDTLAVADSLGGDTLAVADSLRTDSLAVADSLGGDTPVVADSLGGDTPVVADSLGGDSLAVADSLGGDTPVVADSLGADSLARADSSASGASPTGGFALEQNSPNPNRPGTAPADSLESANKSPAAVQPAAADSLSKPQKADSSKITGSGSN